MSSPTSPPPKKNRKPLIAVIIIVLVVALAAGAYLATRGNGGTTNPSTTPTPAPTPTPTSNPGTSPSATPQPSTSGTGANIAGASSLQYSVAVTSNGVSQGSYTYSGKNIGTTNFMMRISSTDASGSQSIFIINGAQQTAWSYSDGTWTDLSAAYSSQYTTWNTLWQGYAGALSAWNGLGDYTYSSGGDSVRIYDVSVNPSLPDSLFQHS